MQSVLEVVRKVAPTDATVLISGESGTGKEMVARFLREQSLRGKGPLVTVDCGSIAPSLIETELFGHAKGAYTGAIGSSQGRIVQSEGGTIFLDEIGELPLDMQAKLLRFVQEREITPVGASRSRKIDVRIVAATNRDLAAEVAAGRFRQDLYYRLQVVSVTVPPLRQRPEDILPLAQYFVEMFAADYKKGVQRISADAQSALIEHTWPGNVRELQNRLRQAVIMCDREEIGRFDLHLDGASTEEDRLHVSIARFPTGAEGSASEPVSTSPLPAVDSSSIDDSQVVATSDGNPWEVLRDVLARQVEAAINNKNVARVTLGVWLTEDLVLAADEAHRGVARKASDAIGMAETTFRRHLEKAKYARQQGMVSRCTQWSTTKPVIDHLVRSANRKQGENVVLKARGLLLAEVIPRLPRGDMRGAVLMGVTRPTYRRWKAEDHPSRFEQADGHAGSDPGGNEGPF